MTNKKLGRYAGLTYLILIIAGVVSLLYVPSQIYVSGDPMATANNIKSSESLFRFGISMELLCFLAFLILPLLLYKIFHSINKPASILMVVFVLVSIPITYLGIVNELTALNLVRSTDPISSETATDVMILMKSYIMGTWVAQIFWGLWLLPFGYMVYQSGLIPKILGILLMLGCLGYLIDSFGKIVWADYGDWSLAPYILIPATIGEFGTCFWLLIMGAKENPPK